MKDNALGRFIKTEMAARGMKQEQFAEFMGSSQSTVGRIIRGEIQDPSLDFLVKLSKATHFDICSLVYLIRPDAFKGPPGIEILAEQIRRLPDQQRQLVEVLLTGMLIKQGDEGNEGG